MVLPLIMKLKIPKDPLRFKCWGFKVVYFKKFTIEKYQNSEDLNVRALRLHIERLT